MTLKRIGNMVLIAMDDIYYIYIILRRSMRTDKLTVYTGYTNNFYRRAKEHESGRTKANRGYELTLIKIVGTTPTQKLAMRYEKMIKKLTHNEKMELIGNDYKGKESIITEQI